MILMELGCYNIEFYITNLNLKFISKTTCVLKHTNFLIMVLLSQFAFILIS